MNHVDYVHQNVLRTIDSSKEFEDEQVGTLQHEEVKTEAIINSQGNRTVTVKENNHTTLHSSIAYVIMVLQKRNFGSTKINL